MASPAHGSAASTGWKGRPRQSSPLQNVLTMSLDEIGETRDPNDEKARSWLVPGLKGKTFGEHLDDFDNQLDDNGRSFDELVTQYVEDMLEGRLVVPATCPSHSFRNTASQPASTPFSFNTGKNPNTSSQTLGTTSFSAYSPMGPASMRRPPPGKQQNSGGAASPPGGKPLKYRSAKVFGSPPPRKPAGPTGSTTKGNN